MRTPAGKSLTRTQIGVLSVAFVPMLATGVFGGIGTYSNISGAYGSGTALGAVAAGEGATAVLALVLLGLTMLGQSSPLIIRLGLWALPAAASAMAAMAADDPGTTVIYAITPMGMCVSAEGMAFLARRIAVHTEGRDAEGERRAVELVQKLAYHRARATNHPDDNVRKRSVRASWRLARKVGSGDAALGTKLLDVQRERITIGADAALGSMFLLAPDALPIEGRNAEESTETTMNGSTADLPVSTPEPITTNPLALPRAVAVGFLKSTLPLKPLPAIEPPPVRPIEARPVAAESPRPRRATGRVPESARPSQPRRTWSEVLEQAHEITAKWPDKDLTAEGIRRAVRTSPERARTLRDTLRAERGLKAA
ncbi:conjugal transfer protein [Streptomyces sp. NBC_01381]|uniref:conjugal transfer protein n=1 Tax=Streptomyces sp. NBC_01381 TaxID=2903845 RepID=UPI002254E50F|nr:conjugal transfer protein [Streptomyces sp. NBC_01381]MCX4669971.1 conjugal transfer protein [Streptomyces sp. NBC_01381]